MESSDQIYDHYKETCQLNRDAVHQRDQDFRYLCVVEAVSFFTMLRPETVLLLLERGISEKLKQTVTIGSDILQCVMWMGIVYFTIRYIQSAMRVERQYPYMNKLEQKLRENEQSGLLSREGDTYQREYPIVLNFVELFYKLLMPITFFALNLIHIFYEVCYTTPSIPTLGFDCFSVSVVSLMLWFYFFEVHTKTTMFFKSKCHWIQRCSDFIHRILKEV